MASEHLKRFRKWQNLCPPATRALARAVNEQLVPQIEEFGFQRVDVYLDDPEHLVSGSEIALERSRGEFIDEVEFRFEKYRRPQFQVGFRRRPAADKTDIIRGGYLVPRNSKYYWFWGKPWWVPARFWTSAAAQRTVTQVGKRLSEIPAFLESAERGPSISKDPGVVRVSRRDA